jgi:hypothetical protein
MTARLRASHLDDGSDPLHPARAMTERLQRARPLRRRPTRSSVGLLVVLGACEPSAAPPEPSDPAQRSASPLAGAWIDRTDELLDSTDGWTNKVELADLDGDGSLDLLFANGGDYSTPGEPELNRAFLNAGAGARFEDVSAAVFGSRPDLTRVIKARDADGDGHVDVFVGNTYETASRLFVGQGGGRFEERPGRIPSRPMSLGDAEFGDVDGDGDLDLVLADWGGGFSDETERRMPDVLVRFSWDLELVDVDNDHDLDVVVSCKRCAGSKLFRNDGSGVFEDDPRGLPQYTNNYELEAMDLDRDGFLDLVTINDGDIVAERSSSRREHVFRNDGEGRFRDATDGWWADAENIGEDDNVVAFLDVDSDGDADFLIGSLSGPDRLLINDGAGGLTSWNDVFAGAETPGTLGMAIGDLDGDGRIDVVQSQGEHPTAIQERIFMGVGLAPDTAPPVVSLVTAVAHAGGRLVRARVHDHKSPTLDAEWQAVEVRYRVQSQSRSRAMAWYGGYLWRAVLPEDAAAIEVCATDAGGNSACAGLQDSPGQEAGVGGS